MNGGSELPAFLLGAVVITNNKSVVNSTGPYSILDLMPENEEVFKNSSLHHLLHLEVRESVLLEAGVDVMEA